MMSVAFGCMRLSTDPERDEQRGIAVIDAALDAGATLLDTAPSYALGEADTHHNERLIARALAQRPLAAPRVATKVGLVRVGSAWQPDGRAKAIRSSCEASLLALNAASVDTVFLHCVDPQTSLATSARALAELARAGLARRIGLCNVTVAQVAEARRYVEVAALQVAVSPFDHAALLGGVVRYGIDHGIEVFAHSPFGGPKRARRLAKDREIAAIAAEHAMSPWAVVVAWLRSLGVSAVPGSRDPERASEAVRAAGMRLDPAASTRLSERFCAVRPAPVSAGASRGEVVLVMGLQAAGKSTYVVGFQARGYARLNRDELGGTLRDLAKALDEQAAAGGSRFVLDNTYATRASRAQVVHVALRNQLPVRCVWIDTPIESANVQAVERLLDRHGRLPAPDELRLLSRDDPHAFGPATLLRTQRELEPPSEDEGFSTIERVPFARRARAWEEHAGLVVELSTLFEREALAREIGDLAPTRTLVFAWLPGGSTAAVTGRASEACERIGLGRFDVALCTHPAGPPTCWCRPPLPGLLLPWLREHRIAPARSMLVGRHAAHTAMARALGFDERRLLRSLAR